MKRLVALLVLLIASLLVACGGGGADEAPQGPLNSIPVARAGTDQSVAVGIQAVFDGTASSDPDGDGITYAWRLTSAPAGSTAALSGQATSRPTLTPDREGTYTLSLTVNDGKANSSASTTTVTASAPVSPQIVVDIAEPLSGLVRLTLTGTATGAITWYVDLQLLGVGGSGAGAPLTWNTAQVSNGTHQIAARIQTSAAAFEEVRRTVTVSNSTVTMSASTSGTTGTINVDVRATSAFGITSVSAMFDGAGAGSLTTPNACSRFCSGANDIYRFTVDAARAGSGSHTMVITASDGAGDNKQITVPVPVSNAPVLVLTGLQDGALLYGTLLVRGTTVTDKPGVVTVTAKLGDFEFLRTTASNFSGNYDLAGLAAGPYTLTVLAIDATGQSTQMQLGIVVTSASGLAYSPLFKLPNGGQLLAIEGTKLLYVAAEGSVVLHEMSNATEAVLAGAATIQYATDWQITGGRVYVQGKGIDCASNFVCIYEWDASGRVTNLSSTNPFAGTSYQENPVAKGGYVIWTNWSGVNQGSYTLYNVAAATYTQIPKPAGVNYVGNTDYDFTLVGGAVHFYFWGQTGGDGTASTFDVYKWQSDTGTSTPLTQGGGRSIYTQTDGVRAAWQQSPVGGNADGTFALMTLPVAGGPSTSSSSNANRFILRDGVLAWTESTATSKATRASTLGATSTLTGLSTATLYANGGGQVIYGQQGKVYSWNSTNGVSTLRLETAPSQLLIGGGAMVFVIGTTVYRVAL
jgi:hypothetical protein